MKQGEHLLQCAVVEWWALAHHQLGVPVHLLFAIPNAGRRPAYVGAKLKREGLRPGIPDMMLAAPRGKYHGLFIEHKIDKRRPTAAQMDCMEALLQQGYRVAVSYRCEDTISIIGSYLKEGI